MAQHAHVPAAEQLRAAISILASAAADRRWGAGDVVRVRPAGRLQLGDQPQVVDAATVYMAARGLVGALLDDLTTSTGRELDDVVGSWLVTLQVREALADVGVDGRAVDDGQMGDAA
jgi:hypothetical protein